MTKKGKGVPAKGFAGKSLPGKRKAPDPPETKAKSGTRKRKPSGVLRFVDDAAYVVDDDDEVSDDLSDWESDFLDDDDVGAELSKPSSSKGGKVVLPFLKDEEMSVEEVERMVNERYKRGSGHVRFSEDTKYNDVEEVLPPDAKLWRVKCSVGREREVVICLLEKFRHLISVGDKMQVKSAFAVDHISGYIYVEADKSSEVNDALKGIRNVYMGMMAPVPYTDIPHLFSVRKKVFEISKNMWVQVKSGKYKGDIAKVYDVDEARKKATIKLVPRVDLQAVVNRLERKLALSEVDVPAARLITAIEMEKYKAYFKLRRDRRTGEIFHAMDDLTIKDGFVYKKVSTDSLNCWGVQPSDEEVWRFQQTREDNGKLHELYDIQRKGKSVKIDNVSGDKSDGLVEGTSSNKFELFDLVLLEHKEYGVIVGMEAGGFMILKPRCERLEVVNVKLQTVKRRWCDKNATALDRHKKRVTLNDNVRVLEGPFKDKEGIIKHIFRDILFIYGCKEEKANGFFCAKAYSCQETSSFLGSQSESGYGSGSLGFDPFTSGTDQESTGLGHQFKKRVRRSIRVGDEEFFIGQTLRIRVGPLKGHICRVIDGYRSEITVKLDSLMKVIRVKPEDLSQNSSSGYSGTNKDDFGSTSEAMNGRTGDPTSTGLWDTSHPSSSRDWNDVLPASGDKGGDQGDGWSKEATGVSDTARGQAVNENKNDADPWSQPAGNNSQESSWNKSAAADGADVGWGEAQDLSKSNIAGETASRHSKEDAWNKEAGSNADAAKEASVWGSGNEQGEKVGHDQVWNEDAKEPSLQSWDNNGDSGNNTQNPSKSAFGQAETSTGWNSPSFGNKNDGSSFKADGGSSSQWSQGPDQQKSILGPYSAGDCKKNDAWGTSNAAGDWSKPNNSWGGGSRAQEYDGQNSRQFGGGQTDYNEGGRGSGRGRTDSQQGRCWSETAPSSERNDLTSDQADGWNSSAAVTKSQEDAGKDGQGWNSRKDVEDLQSKSPSGQAEEPWSKAAAPSHSDGWNSSATAVQSKEVSGQADDSWGKAPAASSGTIQADGWNSSAAAVKSQEVSGQAEDPWNKATGASSGTVQTNGWNSSVALNSGTSEADGWNSSANSSVPKSSGWGQSSNASWSKTSDWGQKSVSNDWNKPQTDGSQGWERPRFGDGGNEGYRGRGRGFGRNGGGRDGGFDRNDGGSDGGYGRNGGGRGRGYGRNGGGREGGFGRNGEDGSFDRHGGGRDEGFGRNGGGEDGGFGGRRGGRGFGRNGGNRDGGFGRNGGGRGRGFGRNGGGGDGGFDRNGGDGDSGFGRNDGGGDGGFDRNGGGRGRGFGRNGGGRDGGSSWNGGGRDGGFGRNGGGGGGGGFGRNGGGRGGGFGRNGGGRDGGYGGNGGGGDGDFGRNAGGSDGGFGGGRHDGRNSVGGWGKTGEGSSGGWGKTGEGSSGGWGSKAGEGNSGGWGNNTGKGSNGGWGNNTGEGNSGGEGSTGEGSAGGWGNTTREGNSGGGGSTGGGTTGGWGNNTGKGNSGGGGSTGEGNAGGWGNNTGEGNSGGGGSTAGEGMVGKW